MYYTYAHYKPDGSIFYIGKGSGIRAWKKTRRNQYWKNIVAKYKTYSIKILANWETEKEALNHEIELILQYKKLGYKLANMTSGGEGTSGLKLSENHKQKIREANSGIKNWAYGKPKPKNVKQKISKTKINQNLRGLNCIHFKGTILATNIKSKVQQQLNGTAELLAAGFNNSNVYACLNKKRKSHKGHSFKRIEI